MEPIYGCWYDASKESVAGLLGSEALRLFNEDQPRLEHLQRNLRLYGGSRGINIRPWDRPAGGSEWDGAEAGNSTKLRLNVVKATVDTITAKVGKLRPRPTFMTSKGDWSTQRRAKDLQVFMDGAYHQSDVYELALDAFRDAMILGTSPIHTYKHGRRICTERTPAWELFVDRADGMYGKPRCLYRIKWVAQAQVPMLYPDAMEAMPDSDVAWNIAERAELSGTSTSARNGFVRVVEAWCLPCCPPDDIGSYEARSDAKGYRRKCSAYNGRHVLLVGDVLVCDDDWPCETFPFEFLMWSKPTTGFWGESAVIEVLGIQVEINKLLQLVQEAMQKTAMPIVFFHKDASLNVKEIPNLIAQVVEVDADRPLSDVLDVRVFQSVHEQVMQHLWALYAKAFEILGSNQLAASATAPAGLESGRALEALAEEHSERFMSVSRHFEHVLGERQARQFIRVAKEIDASIKERGDSKGFVIRAPNGKVTVQLKWDDVAIDEDGYIIQVFPTSVLPTTPAARIQEVERMATAQWISPTEARRLLNFPDLAADTDLATADGDNLMRQLELMLEKGEVVQPEPYQDLTNAIRVAQQSILRAQTDGTPEQHIDRVRDFIDMAMALLQRTAAPNPAPAAEDVAPGATPSMGPGPAQQ